MVQDSYRRPTGEATKTCAPIEHVRHVRHMRHNSCAYYPGCSLNAERTVEILLRVSLFILCVHGYLHTTALSMCVYAWQVRLCAHEQQWSAGC